MTGFADFFHALWTHDPFPWQAMLAERAARGEWPKAINLPTASGKTACLDAAVFALASTADSPSRMPRRIWFVVDRRIVVDEAFERAQKMALQLAKAKNGPIAEVAGRLRKLSGTGRALAVARLRGGAWRDDGWARLPSQPAIICSTVDQLGSALLFRSYGHSLHTASIFAGLAANDSLILLDEAHCAVPFLETLNAIEQYRGQRWATEPLSSPFRFSVMSATLPPSIGEIPEHATFPKPRERAEALKHRLLRQRFDAHKIATLAKPVKDDKEFVTEAVRCAQRFANDNQRVAVMVNRVATAEDIADSLRTIGKTTDVVLLTGRMRPLDRDELIRRWEKKLKAGSNVALERPVILVTTQCLEVGADFSFEALVTECASLDALRQRFGRLDRLGEIGETHAVILIREKDTKEAKPGEADPIYGRAIYETWNWLADQDKPGASDAPYAPRPRRKAKAERLATVDFGIAAIDARLAEAESQQLEQLLAPTSHSPILLPAHLDLLCQTSRRTAPEPDITLFLHGMDRGAPEAWVVLRADLPDPAKGGNAEDDWMEALSLVPPTSPEMFSVPLYRLRGWLSQPESADNTGDVQGAGWSLDADDDSNSRNDGPHKYRFLIWRGRNTQSAHERSQLSDEPRLIRPGDIVVLRAADVENGGGLHGLGQVLEPREGFGTGRLDLAERAFRQARSRAVLRIQPDLLRPLHDVRGAGPLLELAANLEVQRDDIESALDEVLKASTTASNDAAAKPNLPAWLLETIQQLRSNFRFEAHPAGGVVLLGTRRLRPGEATNAEERDEADEVEDDIFANEDDLTSKLDEAVSLQQHTADVRSTVDQFVSHCGLTEEFAAIYAAAADGHDLGKLDRRFQIMLRDGDPVAAEDKPLAKSAHLPEGRRRRRQDDEDSRLPRGFRHEFLSLQLAEHFGLTPDDEAARDLALHLIASHHGNARPFAPVVPDALQDGVDDVDLAAVGVQATFTAAERRKHPPDRLDSGIADRFWRLNRRHGWWGLAYLEAIFRLADWEASRRPLNTTIKAEHLSRWVTAPLPRAKLPLNALDGANPLAFLAALGTLRVLTRAFPEQDLRMNWEQRMGAWRPSIWSITPLQPDVVVAALHANGLDLDTMFSRELLKNSKDLRFDSARYREFCRLSTERTGPDVRHEYASTWASEIEDPKNPAVVYKTAFHFTAGNQKFCAMIENLRKSCRESDLKQSLFTGWKYTSAAPSMRWDPYDEKRQYALQAVDPTDNSRNAPLSDAGANFLAVEALPLFPIAPDKPWPEQPGFHRNKGQRDWSWPIWNCAIGLDAVRCLLVLELGDWQQWPPATRHALGVPAVFRSNIVKPSGRYRCFTPSRCL